MHDGMEKEGLRVPRVQVHEAKPEAKRGACMDDCDNGKDGDGKDRERDYIWSWIATVDG